MSLYPFRDALICFVLLKFDINGEFMERYAARVEYLAIKEDAIKMRDQGYGYKMIYDKFFSAGKITMNYRTFYGYLKKKENPSTPPQENESEETPKRKLGVSNNDSLIKHSNLPRREDLI